MDIQGWNYLISMAATVAFAVTAVLAVTDHDIDLFGAVVFGIITAVGGGTIRDVILEVPVFWSTELVYIWVAIAASIVAYMARPLFTRHQMYQFMLYLDGFGAVLFGVQASGKVWDLGFGLPVAPVILGVITAIGGGLTRDVLANRTTLLMKRELYAIPVLLGCILFCMVLAYAPAKRFVGGMVAIVLSFGLRAAAIHWNLAIPRWSASKDLK